jgi:UrcA family protein
MFNFKTVVLAAAAALSVSAMGVAGAQSNGAEAPKLVVRYHASALESEDGVRHLYHQLLVAAEKVCPQPMGRLPNEAVVECRKQAVAGAVEKIHNTRLATLSGTDAKIG